MKKEPPVRYPHLDFLRTCGILVIILTHTLSYYLSHRIIFTIWNYIHFVVVLLVFCSGYLMIAQNKNSFTKPREIFSWYKKRLIRLIIPFYTYLLIHYFLWFFLPRFFNGLNLKKNFDFILQSVLFTGGVDFNWFVLLFIQLTVLFPLVICSFRKKIYFLLFISLMLISAIFFTLINFPGPTYRFVMWAGWLNIIFLSVFIYQQETKDTVLFETLKRYFFIGLTAGIFFLLMRVGLIGFRGKDLVLTKHKYPPDALYLSYGIAVSCIFLIISRIKQLSSGILGRIFQFIGRRTYQLFFIHYIVLDFSLKTTKNYLFWSQPLILSLLVIILSLVIAYLIANFKKYLLAIIIIILVLVSTGNSLNCKSIDKNPIAKSSILEWLQKPAAVRYVGRYDRTYISWIEQSGKVQLRYYDHKKKSFSKIITIDDLYPDYGIESQDDHNAPCLLILPDGQLLIFYTVHDVNNAFFMKKSLNSEDPFFWTGRLNISHSDTGAQYNYPQAKRLDNGNLILFYRRGVHYNSDEYFKISKDNGSTWGRGTKLIDFGEDGVYIFVHTKNNQIHIAWNKSIAENPKKNVYYAYSPDGGNSWKKKDNKLLDLPITKAKADLVFNSGNQSDYVWDIITDDKNNPFIVYAYRDDPEHEFRFAQWDGAAWINSTITNSSLIYNSGHFFSGGIVIDPLNVYQVYLSKKQNKLEIEKWSSIDFGKTWKQTEAITKNSAVDNFRPQIVQNYAKELRLIWSSGNYEGLIDSQWSGFSKVNIQSEITKASIPSTDKCEN